ncbi:hypothetical protein D3C73_480500 [compost metagenome]
MALVLRPEMLRLVRAAILAVEKAAKSAEFNTASWADVSTATCRFVRAAIWAVFNASN